MEFDVKSSAISTLIALIVVGFIALFVDGCATIRTFDPGENAKMKAPFFIGTQYNATKLMSDNGTLPAIIDFPFSFAGDWLLFPGHVVLYYVNDDQDISGPYKK